VRTLDHLLTTILVNALYLTFVDYGGLFINIGKHMGFC